MTYDIKDLINTYKELGIKKGDTVYVTGDLVSLGRSIYNTKEEILNAHYQALREVTGEDEGTIVVPTHTYFLCNTENPFDIEKTAGNRGVLPEYIRKKEGSVRQRHPFGSCTAIGKNADYICLNCSRHSFGHFTPFSRMIELETKFINIGGLAPRQTCTQIHQAEYEMNVPYRYTKEFVHPIVQPNGKIKKEPFYQHVHYLQCKVNEIKDHNKKIFANFTSQYAVKTKPVGNSKIDCYSMTEFHKATIELLKKDIFACLGGKEPKEKPYRETV